MLNKSISDSLNRKRFRSRTVFNELQLKMLKAFFVSEQNPDRIILNQLQAITGLDKKVIQVCTKIQCTVDMLGKKLLTVEYDIQGDF